MHKTVAYGGYKVLWMHYKLLIVGTHPYYHVFHSKLSFLLSLMPVTSLITPINDSQS